MVNKRGFVKVIGIVVSTLMLSGFILVSLGETEAPASKQMYRQGQNTPGGPLQQDSQPLPGRQDDQPLAAQFVTPGTEFQVVYNPNGGCTNPQPWPNEAMDAFNAAIAVWDSLLNVTQTVVINACYQPDASPDTLASAGPTDNLVNFSNAPQADTAYPIALVNQLAGADQNGTAAEISASTNTTIAWSFATDSSVPNDQYDFVSTMLHEIAHGLGFLDSFDENGNFGLNGDGLNPNIYDRFVVNGANDVLIDTFANGSVGMQGALVSDNIFFNGPNAMLLNGGTSPQLFAPNPYQQGSSIGHLDDNTYSGALMTSATNPGLSSRFPSPRTLGIFQDIGWQVNLLSLLKSASASQIEAGQTLTYTLRATNSDTTLQTNIILTDTVPANTSLITASLSGDATYADVTPGSVITWTTTSNLAQGDVLTRSYAVQVATEASGMITNTAYVSAELRAASNTVYVTVAGSNKIYLPIVIK